ncbi:MAG: response regulator [Alphaproteobacteria bacterium]|nr:response regulator [Alphaproteobacteria bacterium]
MKILIVEDEALLAATLKQLVELNPLYEVTAIAEDLTEAMAAVEANAPELALVDLQLANGSSGFAVAARLHALGIACLFTTGNAPGFPVPDLALGCLRKPFETDDLTRALKEAEDILRGRQKIVRHPRLPEQLQLYTPGAQPAANEEEWVPGVRRRTSLWARVRRLVRHPSSFRSATVA